MAIAVSSQGDAGEADASSPAARRADQHKRDQQAPAPGHEAGHDGAAAAPERERVGKRESQWRLNDSRRSGLAAAQSSLYSAPLTPQPRTRFMAAAIPRCRRHRQRHRRRDRPGRRRVPRRARPRQGHDDADRRGARRARSTRRWGRRVEISGGSAANTMAGIASLGGSGAYIGKVARRPARRGLRATTSARIGVRFDTPPRAERPADRALPHPGHARRAAHHEHLPRRLRRARARGRRRADLVAPRRSPISRAICSTRRAAKAAFRKAARARACRRAARWRSPLSDPFCVDRHRAEFRDLVARPCRHPLRQRGRDLLALRDRRFRRGARAPCAATARSPR